MLASPIHSSYCFCQLVAIEKRPPLNSGARKWKCRCDCGGERLAASYNLRRGKTKSCGCLSREPRHSTEIRTGVSPLKGQHPARKRKREGGPRRDSVRVGERFGRLLVIDYLPSRAQGIRCLCRCDCGNETAVSGKALRSNHSQSCGCRAYEMRGAKQRKHGEGYRKTREYITWLSMRSRGLNHKNNRWKRYGGRGIRVCDRWLNS